jgi:hypothetical protein
MFDLLAERRILEALARGELDDLPGSGRPLDLDDDLLVPPETRLAARVLKNAGFVPLEVLERRELAELEARLPEAEGEARMRALSRLALLRTRLEARGSRMAARGYTRKILEKLARRS